MSLLLHLLISLFGSCGLLYLLGRYYYSFVIYSQKDTFSSTNIIAEFFAIIFLSFIAYQSICKSIVILLQWIGDN